MFVIDVYIHIWQFADILIEKKGIVGARAVVTKDVKAGNVVAGNPAKVIGHR